MADLPPLPKPKYYLAEYDEIYGSLEAAQQVCDYYNECEKELQEKDLKYFDPDWEPSKPEPLFSAYQMHEYANNVLSKLLRNEKQTRK